MDKITKMHVYALIMTKCEVQMAGMTIAQEEVKENSKNTRLRAVNIIIFKCFQCKTIFQSK